MSNYLDWYAFGSNHLCLDKIRYSSWYWGGVDQLANPFVVAATGLVSGLYTREVYDKFHEVFETLFKTERRRGDGLKPAKKYPSTVADIVENAIMPDDVKVVYYEKDNFKEVDIDAQCKQAISLGKSYWKITLREGKDGIFWIRDEDQQIVCEYRAT